LSQLLRRQECSGLPSKSRVKTQLSAYCPADKDEGLRFRVMIRPREPAHAAVPQGISTDQLLRYSG
jgi:hypothetical protein